MPWKLLIWGAVWLVIACRPAEIFGQSAESEGDPLWERLLSAEARIHELEAFQRETSQIESSGVEASQVETSPMAASQEWDETLPGGFSWEVGYDRGFIIRPFDREENPFELRVNGRMQARHTGFARHVHEWRDNAGVVHPVRNRNDFEIERGRLEFRGFFLDPNLQFFMNLDADTDDGNVIIMHDFWINYEFSKAFDLYFGKAFVPGSRDWLNGSLRTRFADRSMATTFFRPDRTAGVWAMGEPVEKVFYRVMVGNGFSTTDLTPDEIDTQFVYSASSWMDLGDYGEGYSDLEWHELPVSQIGQSFTFASSGGRSVEGRPLAEANFVRLSDGTRLTQLGALTPGVSIDHLDIYLYAVDAALKYRGFSLNSEYYLRWLQSLRGDGPLPLGKLFDHGFKFEAGYFLLPQKLEVNGRISQVFGPFGDGQEYAGGINWFFNGSHGLKLTLDVTKLNHNPANNTGPNLRAGDDGVLIRTQFQAAF
jgi:hypothetical protein